MLVKCDECVVRACVVWIIANTLRPKEIVFLFGFGHTLEKAILYFL